MSTVIGGRYRHYKGEEYTVLALARDETTLTEKVVYQAEYDTEDFGPRPIWIRDRELFEGTVEHEGKTIKRFQLLD